jgi:hypothetical protein
VDTNESLEIKVAKFRKANNYLARVARVAPRTRIVLEAKDDADHLAMLYLAGYRTGKGSAATWGISDHRWYYARALLQVAGVYDTGWKSEDPRLIEWSISVAAERCLDNPDLMLWRLPLCRQLRRKT